MSDEVLEDHQVELLRSLVEAHRGVSPREEFLVVRFMGADPRAGLLHPGLPKGFGAPLSDLKALAAEGLIRLEQKDYGTWLFSVMPRGIDYYAKVRQHTGVPSERVEETIRRLFATEGFQERYPSAYGKWTKAESLLWAADAQEQLSAVGHHCREAMQEFAAALLTQHQPPDCSINREATVARIRAVLAARRSSLPSTVYPFLDALVVYWGTLADLVQRQEHGALKEGMPLAWQDARRVVFHTMIVMCEIDWALTASQR